MRVKMLIISVLFVFTGLFANAQSHNEQVTVESSYKPQIKRSERLQKMPETPVNEFELPSYKVDAKDFSYGYNVEVETMSALSYKAEYGIDGKNNFLKAGLGTRVSPLFLFRHYSDVSRNMSLGVGVKHYSSWLDMKDYKKSSFMNNDFNVMTINKFKNGQLRLSGDYKYDMYHLRADVDNGNGRNIHSVNVGAKWLANGSSYRDLYNEFGGSYKATWIAGSITEHQLNAIAHLAYSDNWISDRNVDDLQTAAADMEMCYDNVYQGQFLLAVNPYFTMSGAFYNIHAGLRVDFKTSDNVGFYPDIAGSVFILDNTLEFYAKLGGHSKINTFADVVAENPFITTNFANFSEFGYEKTKIDFQSGIKVKIINNVDAHVGVRYRSIKNALFYVPDPDFYATYDEDATIYHLQAFDLILQDCNVLNILADVRWAVAEKMSLAAELSINSYKLPEMMIIHIPSVAVLYGNAWYKPKFNITLRGDYQFDETWKFNAAINIIGKREALNLDKQVVELKPAFDVQLGADYKMTDDLAAFAEIHNLFHNKYQLYYNYPSVGFEIFAGLKYRF